MATKPKALPLPALIRQRTLLENQIDRVKVAHAARQRTYDGQIVDLHARLEAVEQQIIGLGGAASTRKESGG